MTTALLDRTAPDWERAACKDFADDTFWPVGDIHSTAGLKQAQLAAAVCSACPLTLACHEYRMERPDLIGGVWAGAFWSDKGRAVRLLLPTTHPHYHRIKADLLSRVNGRNFR